MKNLSESLFDNDLAEKNVGFFDYYDWHCGRTTIVYDDGTGRSVPLETAIGHNFKFDQLFKKDKLNKLPHPKELVKKSNDEYIFRNIYNTLSNTSVEELGDRWKFANVVVNSIKELIKVDTFGGWTHCDIFPRAGYSKTIIDDKINSITILDATNFKIDRVTYTLKVYVSFKRKHNMKSLSESLFDKDLIEKDITFGGMFEYSKSRILMFDKKLPVLYKKTFIKTDSGVSYANSDDQIINGLVKIILDTPVNSSIDKEEFRKRITPLMKYYTSFVNNSIRMSTHKWPWPFGYKNGHLILDTDWTLDEPDEIRISLIGLELTFIKK